MDDVELLPCPFCGNDKLSVYNLNYNGNPWVIRCNSPDCPIQPFRSFIKPIFGTSHSASEC